MLNHVSWWEFVGGVCAILLGLIIAYTIVVGGWIAWHRPPLTGIEAARAEFNTKCSSSNATLVPNTGYADPKLWTCENKGVNRDW